jgi:SAM-dependent methyltransferase
LKARVPDSNPAEPLRVLEIGAGIGTMVERMLDWGLLGYAQYTAIDAMGENIRLARSRLAARAEGGEQGRRGEGERKGRGEWELRSKGEGEKRIGDLRGANEAEIVISGEGLRVHVELEAVDLYDFAAREGGQREWDLVLAHSFLDLVDAPSALAAIFPLRRPGGLFYFTINFDGLTVLEPVIDPILDELILELYHRTMDERTAAGKSSGDSRAGRHLFRQIREAGGAILAAGSSDWVVYPVAGGYLEGEADFLHFILEMIYQELRRRPELEAGRFEDWIVKRRAQIERGELVYIAHQMDFLGSI